MSSTVGNVLKSFGPPEATETANFCLLMDKFFDCFNVRNCREFETKRKPFLKPYKDINDERFRWLNEFLRYFETWKEAIDNRPGNFNAIERGKMFISRQTHEGLLITVRSLQSLIPFLLNSGISYVLSEKFCQDDIENYFGRRAIGYNKDNPNLRDFGYSDNTIRSQYSVRPIEGNVKGDVSRWNIIDEQSLPKRLK